MINIESLYLLFVSPTMKKLDDKNNGFLFNMNKKLF